MAPPHCIEETNEIINEECSGYELAAHKESAWKKSRPSHYPSHSCCIAWPAWLSPLSSADAFAFRPLAEVSDLPSSPATPPQPWALISSGVRCKLPFKATTRQYPLNRLSLLPANSWDRDRRGRLITSPISSPCRFTFSAETQLPDAARRQANICSVLFQRRSFTTLVTSFPPLRNFLQLYPILCH